MTSHAMVAGESAARLIELFASMDRRVNADGTWHIEGSFELSDGDVLARALMRSRG